MVYPRAAFMSPSALVQRALAQSLKHLPPAVARRALASRSPRDGFELDPTTAVLLALADRIAPPSAHEVPLDVGRRNFKASIPIVEAAKDGSVVTEAGTAGGVPVRTYRPARADRPAPGIVYFHGGGWVLGDLDTHDGACRFLASELSAVVVSVHYRLAPEHKAPTAAEDAYAAFQEIRRDHVRYGLDPRRIAVSGDSAGGNLSAVVCLLARDRGAPMPAAQGLIYPAVDLRRSFPSHQTFEKGYFLDGDIMDWFIRQYASPDQLTDPIVSPLCAKSHVGLPPAVVVTAGFDPLRDEGRAYADKLEAAGVPTRYRCARGLVHGFAQMGGAVPAARAAMKTFAKDLREAWS